MRQFFLIFFLYVLTCLGQEVTVTQDKSFMVTNVGNSANFQCEYRGTTATYNIYWYQQKPGTGLELIAYSVSEDDSTVESKFSPSWSMGRSETTKSSLQCNKITSGESAVYYCAASYRWGPTSTVYFGSGTVISVLENGKEQKKPNVSIYRPNKRELEDHNFISLVCVASDFYPEHVKIQWFVNSVERINLYEPAPQKKENDSYSTSKRLTLTREEYFNPDSTFRCDAAFLDGSLKASEEIKGETDCGVSKEFYTMYINQGKISYVMVLCKSGLYALVVLVLVWRKRVIAHSY